MKKFTKKQQLRSKIFIASYIGSRVSRRIDVENMLVATTMEGEGSGGGNTEFKREKEKRIERERERER